MDTEQENATLLFHFKQIKGTKVKQLVIVFSGLTACYSEQRTTEAMEALASGASLRLKR